MASELNRRHSRRPVSTANRDRALERIERELRVIIENSPIVRKAVARGDMLAARALVESTLPCWPPLVQNIRALWE